MQDKPYARTTTWPEIQTTWKGRVIRGGAVVVESALEWEVDGIGETLFRSDKASTRSHWRHGVCQATVGERRVELRDRRRDGTKQKLQSSGCCPQAEMRQRKDKTEPGTKRN